MGFDGKWGGNWWKIGVFLNGFLLGGLEHEFDVSIYLE